MNKEIENLELQFTPFASEIIGADDKYVYLKEGFDTEFFIIKIKQKLYLECCSSWLNSKAEFCKRYNHFCGVYGNMNVEEYKNSGEINIVVDYTGEEDDLKPIYKNVPIYEVISMNFYVDMEHG